VRPESAEYSYEYHPIPEEDINGLVVKVNGQYTLHGVRVYVHHVLTSHLQITQRNMKADL